VFGGWKTEFTVGYNVPTSTYLATEYSSGKYVLRVPFIPDWEFGIAITNHVLKVILPEGSSDISVHAPFDVSESYDHVITYLDSKNFGRPTALISKNNLANIHNQYIEISYHFSSSFLLWEPILLIGSYAIIFLAFILCLRIDLSIEESKSSLTDEKVLNALNEITEIFTDREDLHNRLEDVFDQFLKDSDQKTYDGEKKNIANNFASFKRKAEGLIDGIRTKQADLASKLQELDKKQSDKEKVQVQLIDLKYKKKTTKNISNDTYEREKSTLQEKYDNLSEDIQSDIEELLEK